MYLSKLVKKRAPDLCVIPEEKSRTGKGDVSTKSAISRQDRTMSRTAPRSRCCIEDPSRLENGLAANPVATLLDGLAVDQIHLATQKPGEFPLEVLEMRHPGPFGSVSKTNKEIDVAVGIEAGAQNGAENREFSDPEPLTEASNLVQWKMFGWILGHGSEPLEEFYPDLPCRIG